MKKEITETKNKISKLKEYKTLIALMERISQIEGELSEIENFIVSVNDSRARQIIEYKYVDGLTWSAAASKLYGYPCADRARKYLKKILKNS